MEEHLLSSALRVDTPEQAAVFLDPKRRRILTLFMAQERSLSDAAMALDMPMNRLAHHVGNFLRLGLLKIVREQKRAGRPIRYYRAVAKCFFVAAGAMGRRASQGLAAALDAALERAETVAGASDMLLFLDETGRAVMRRHGGAAGSDACEYWRMLSLSRGEARALARELGDLLARYEGRHKGRGQAYLAHVALAPRRSA